MALLEKKTQDIPLSGDWDELILTLTTTHNSCFLLFSAKRIGKNEEKCVISEDWGQINGHL